MKNEIQQCQNCFSMELPSSVYCSQCSAKLNGVSFNFSSKTNVQVKSNRNLLIGLSLLTLLIISIASTVLFRSSKDIAAGPADSNAIKATTTEGSAQIDTSSLNTR